MKPSDDPQSAESLATAGPVAARAVPLRLGAVAYLNMQPLVAGLAEEWGAEGLTVRMGTPSALATWLERGEIDMGMVPVAALFDHPEWRVAGNAMIGSRGPVASVLALGSDPPAAWRRLRPDSHSRTSNVWAQVLLRRVLGAQIELGEPIPPEDWAPPAISPDGEGLVLIGSRALRWRDYCRRGGQATAIDLGELWTHWTGLPFVCALWAVAPGVQLGEWPERLEAQRLRNRSRLDEIIRRWDGLAHDRLTEAQARHYLTENIRYDFDAAARDGLERFYAEGRALGLFTRPWTLRRVGESAITS